MRTAFHVCCQGPVNGFSAGWVLHKLPKPKQELLGARPKKRSFHVNPRDIFIRSSSYTGYELVYYLFIFISAVSKPRAIKLMTKMEE